MAHKPQHVSRIRRQTPCGLKMRGPTYFKHIKACLKCRESAHVSGPSIDGAIDQLVRQAVAAQVRPLVERLGSLEASLSHGLTVSLARPAA